MSEPTEYVITQHITGAFSYQRGNQPYSQPAWGVSRCTYVGDRGQVEPVGWFYDYNAAAAFVEQMQAGDATRSVNR